MKKIMLILVVVFTASSCWKDIATDVMFGVISSSFESDAKKTKKENCDKYKAKYKWESQFKGTILDVVSKGNSVYVLKEVYDYKYELHEINVSTGRLKNSIKFSPNKIEGTNTGTNCEEKDIAYFLCKSNYGFIAAYDTKNRGMLWLKRGEW